MRRAVAAVLLMTAAGCASTAPPPVTATSSATDAAAASAELGSCEHPVVIHAKNEHEGIAREREWLAAHYGFPGHYAQGLGQCNGKEVDSIDFSTANGRHVTVYFDISEWFGKY